MKGKKIVLLLLALTLVFMTCACSEETSRGGTEDIPTLMWYVPSDDQPDKATVMEEVNKILVDKIGAKLDLQFIDYGAYNTRLQTMMASGSNFDLCFAGYINNYNNAATKGGFMDITDLIAEGNSTIRELVPDWLLKQAEIDGRIYGIPNQQVVSMPSAVWVPDYIAEISDFDFGAQEEVKKVTDFEPFLEEIKNKKGDIYSAFSISGFYSDKYEIINSNVAIRKDGSTHEAVLIYNTDEFNEGVNKIHEYYKKGYIRPDIVTADITEDQNLGRIGISISTWKPGDEINTLNAYGYSSKAYFISDPYVGYDSGLATMIAIGRGCKNAEKAIKLIELMNSDKEIYNLVCFGIKDKHYTITAEGKLKLIEGSGYYPNHQWKYGNQFNAYVMDGMDIDVYEKTKQMNEEAVKSPLMGFSLDTSKITSEIAQVSSITSEYQSISKGFEDPNDYMDEYRRRLDEAGQQKILREIQRQLDEFFAKQS